MPPISPSPKNAEMRKFPPLPYPIFLCNDQKADLDGRFIAGCGIAVCVAAGVDEHGPRRERLDGQRLGQNPPAEVECFDINIGHKARCLPHCLEARLCCCGLCSESAVLGTGGPEAPLRDLSRAVPADVDVGVGAIGLGVTPKSGLVDGGGGPVIFEGTVVADAVGPEVGEPNGFAVFGVLGHGWDDSPSNKGISVRKDLHAALTSGGKSSSRGIVLVEDGGCLGRCVDGDDHAG